MGRHPCVHVWDVDTLESKCHLKLKDGSRGVAAVGISPCLRYIACADLHNDHHVYIYNIKKGGKQLLAIEGSKEKIIDLAWSKKLNDLRFCTIGLKETKFWNPADATKRLFQKGTFAGKADMTTFNSVVFDTEGYAYTGGRNGSIYIWDGSSSLEKAIKANGCEITSICHENGKLITSGVDSKVVVFGGKGG